MSIDRDGRLPFAVTTSGALHVVELVINRRRTMEPLGEQPFEILVRHLFRDAAKGILVHVLEAPARVIRAQDLAHDVVTHHVAQLLVEQLPLLVNHRVVGGEITVALAHHGDRLAPAVHIPQQNFALEAGVSRAGAVRFKEPARLEAREAFVEIALPPFVVREDAHRVVVAELVDDKAEAGAAVHDHHGKLGAAAFDAVHIGDLRPGKLPVERIEPHQRDFGVLDGFALAPRRAVAGLIEHVHDDVLVAALLVAIIGIE